MLIQKFTAQLYIYFSFTELTAKQAEQAWKIDFPITSTNVFVTSQYWSQADRKKLADHPIP